LVTRSTRRSARARPAVAARWPLVGSGPSRPSVRAKALEFGAFPRVEVGTGSTPLTGSLITRSPLVHRSLALARYGRLCVQKRRTSALFLAQT